MYFNSSTLKNTIVYFCALLWLAIVLFLLFDFLVTGYAPKNILNYTGFEPLTEFDYVLTSENFKKTGAGGKDLKVFPEINNVTLVNKINYYSSINDRTTEGALISKSFTAPKFISLPIAGNPNNKNIHISLREVGSFDSELINIFEFSEYKHFSYGENNNNYEQIWDLYTFRVPQFLEGNTVQIIVQDKTKMADVAWVGVGTPLKPSLSKTLLADTTYLLKTTTPIKNLLFIYLLVLPLFFLKNKINKPINTLWLFTAALTVAWIVNLVLKNSGMIVLISSLTTSVLVYWYIQHLKPYKNDKLTLTNLLSILIIFSTPYIIFTPFNSDHGSLLQNQIVVFFAILTIYLSIRIQDLKAFLLNIPFFGFWAGTKFETGTLVLFISALTFLIRYFNAYSYQRNRELLYMVYACIGITGSLFINSILSSGNTSLILPDRGSQYGVLSGVLLVIWVYLFFKHKRVNNFQLSALALYLLGFGQIIALTFFAAGIENPSETIYENKIDPSVEFLKKVFDVLIFAVTVGTLLYVQELNSMKILAL